MDLLIRNGLHKRGSSPPKPRAMGFFFFTFEKVPWAREFQRKRADLPGPSSRPAQQQHLDPRANPPPSGTINPRELSIKTSPRRSTYDIRPPERPSSNAPSNRTPSPPIVPSTSTTKPTTPPPMEESRGRKRGRKWSPISQGTSKESR